MAFKIYYNKKTRHPAISLSGKEKELWENMEMTHHPSKHDSYIEIITVSTNNSSKSFVRKYIRKDKPGVRGKLYQSLKIKSTSEAAIKKYIKTKKKKMMAI